MTGFYNLQYISFITKTQLLLPPKKVTPSHLPVTATCRPRVVSLKTSAESVKKSTLFERSELRRF